MKDNVDYAKIIKAKINLVDFLSGWNQLLTIQKQKLMMLYLSPSGNQWVMFL